MTSNEFNDLLNIRIDKIRSILQSKASEYATEDRLYNFKEASNQFGLAKPTEVCWGYLLKHLVSVMDLAKGRRPITDSVIDEKIGDSINYLILLEALLKDKL